MRKIYLALAFLFVALGAVGVALPILPTVPFLLLASYFFAKGSQRYYDWFIGTRLYKRRLKPFNDSRSMALGTKIAIVLPVSAMLILSMILVDNLPMRLCIISLLLVKYYYFIFRIKTIRRTPASTKRKQDSHGACGTGNS